MKETIQEKIAKVQELLKEEKAEGWLIYDFRGCNDLAYSFLEIPSSFFFTRRFFYWIPQEGEPIKLVHRIESSHLDHLPGEKWEYSTWQEMEAAVEKMLSRSYTVLMEYSRRGALPYLSKVDAGTADIVREFGVEIKSSANVLSHFVGIWSNEQVKLHLEAARALEEIVNEALSYAQESLSSGKVLNECELQAFLIEGLEKRDLETEHPPIVAVGPHAADPHYSPNEKQALELKLGQVLLIDIWAKKIAPHSVYADITRMAHLGAPSERAQQVFKVVREAQKQALSLVRERFGKGEKIEGWEVDELCRSYITQEGFGEYFTHRTGHNIDQQDHGPGAHLDNFETQDVRALLPKTCFSIEPGIYLPGELGVRLECDVYIHDEGQVIVTGGEQETLMVIDPKQPLEPLALQTPLYEELSHA